MGKIGLSISYVLPLFVIGILFARNRIGNNWKIGLLLTLPLFYVAHWFLLEANEGWPSESELPEQFSLVSASVIEPNQQVNHPGAIYLWLRLAPNDPPRSHKLPYSRALHQQLQRSLDRLHAGHSQIGYTSGRESGRNSAASSNGLTLNFQDAPPPNLPPKSL